jgi:hypothetical protein
VKRFRADLHIHTCLSPCGDLDMSPRAVVAQSNRIGLAMIAVCDHNTAENVTATVRAAASTDLVVLSGLEINSSEEVHTLAIFETPTQALAMQGRVYANLSGCNRPDIFGDQVVANEFDEVEGFNERLLIGATQLGVFDIVKAVHELGGIAVAAHIDRPSYSLVSQLHFIPPDLDLDALEISPNGDREKCLSEISGIDQHCLITSSDAHFLQDIGKAATMFRMEQPCFAELRLALTGAEGRGVEY